MKLKYIILTLVLFVLAGIIAGCGGSKSMVAPPVDGYGTVDGYVKAPAGSDFTADSSLTGTNPVPVAGAAVNVAGFATSVTTDATGYFKIVGAPAGGRTLTVSKDGFGVASLNVNIAKDGTTRAGTNGIITITRAKRSWAILVYMNGNNSLESFTYSDIEEMEKVGSTSGDYVIVERGRKSVQGTDRLLITKSTDPNTVTSKSVMNLPELDMGSVQTLKDFVTWAMNTYPADHYMIDIWNHGLGWYSTKSVLAAPLRGVSYDDLSGNYLSIPELKSALDVGRKFDIITFDACLMAQIEIACELKDVGNYMVASEEDEPGPGFPYDKVLNAVAQSPGISPDQFAKSMSQSYIDSYLNSTDYNFATMSVTQLNNVDTIASKIEDLAKLMNMNMAADKNFYAQAASKSLIMQGYTDYTDFGSYCEAIAGTVPNANIQAAARAAKSSMTNYILYSKTVGSYYSGCTGLTIYLPGGYIPSDAYSAYNRMYFSSVAPDWAAFIRTMTQ